MSCVHPRCQSKLHQLLKERKQLFSLLRCGKITDIRLCLEVENVSAWNKALPSGASDSGDVKSHHTWKKVTGFSPSVVLVEPHGETNLAGSCRFDCSDLSRIITPSVGEAPSVFAAILPSSHSTQRRERSFTVNRCFFLPCPQSSSLFSLLHAQVFVKALFDYDPKEDKAIPCKEAGLAFKKGSILQIMSQDDATWWQAKHEGEANPRAGLIPSKQFQER